MKLYQGIDFSCANYWWSLKVSMRGIFYTPCTREGNVFQRCLSTTGVGLGHDLTRSFSFDHESPDPPLGPDHEPPPLPDPLPPQTMSHPICSSPPARSGLERSATQGRAGAGGVVHMPLNVNAMSFLSYRNLYSWVGWSWYFPSLRWSPPPAVSPR